MPNMSATSSPRKPARFTTKRRTSAAFTARRQSMTRRRWSRKASKSTRYQSCAKTGISTYYTAGRILAASCDGTDFEIGSRRDEFRDPNCGPGGIRCGNELVLHFDELIEMTSQIDMIGRHLDDVREIEARCREIG